MSHKTSNNSYETLARIGTRSNPRNALRFRPTSLTEVGVNVAQPGSKKAVQMEVIVPIRRSRAQSRRVARLTLNGAQARQIYETLSRFYSRES